MNEKAFTLTTVAVSTRNFDNLSTRNFQFRVKGEIIEGFVLKKGEKYLAYRNLCRHLPITLDLQDNSFLSRDKKSIQCHMHGALYDLESGLCTAGPCVGAKLLPLEVEVEEGRLLIRLPDEKPAG